MNDKLIEISKILLHWYDTNKRDLPWRKTKDPYIIWISEVILQQTRVNQGMDYFFRFTHRFPTVSSLAEASDDEILKYWQGLGYYSRARNLHIAAQDIMDRFHGIFPNRYEDILSLKGIGEYTAAAIASFAWNQPYPVVDGNVYRVLSRLFVIETPIDTTKGKKEFKAMAEMLLDRQHAGLHNQAIMELGALQCIPQNPDCNSCPLKELCLAHISNTVSHFPQKEKKIKIKDRFFNYIHISYKGKTFISKRENNDIWKGLYEFPLIETSSAVSFEELVSTPSYRELFKTITSVLLLKSLSFKHILSHQILHTTFYHLQIDQTGPGLSSYLTIQEEELDNYAVSRLIHLYLDQNESTYTRQKSIKEK